MLTVDRFVYSFEVMLTYKACGAAHTVTGSMHHFTYRNNSQKHQFCVDAGMFQTGEQLSNHEMNSHLLFAPKELESIVLTHAHLDHCGRLPYLVARGFRGKIYATQITKDLAEVVMLDAAKQQFNNFVKNETSQKSLNDVSASSEILFSEKDVEQTLKLFEVVDIGKPFKIVNGLEGTFELAGHILGATWLRIIEESSNKQLIMSGDLGNINKPFVPNPILPRATDVTQAIFIETTYGDRLHPTFDPVKKLILEIGETLNSGAKVLIPAFALERSQELLYHLFQAMQTGQVQKVKIFLDSPMAIKVTQIFANNQASFNAKSKEAFKNNLNPFDNEWLELIEDRQQSKELNHYTEPCVIIAGAGMMNGGRILKHLKFHGKDKRNKLLIVGYQSENTLGRKIEEGVRNILIDEEPVTLECQVVKIDGLSAHADQAGLEKWLFAGIPQAVHRSFTDLKIMLVHGEFAASQVFANKINTRLSGNAQTMIPNLGDEITILA